MKKQYEIIKEGSHGFEIGTIVTIKAGEESAMPLMEGWWEPGKSMATFWVLYSEVRSITWWRRLYRAIVGALFGPESHSKERYSQK